MEMRNDRQNNGETLLSLILSATIPLAPLILQVYELGNQLEVEPFERINSALCELGEPRKYSILHNS